MFDRLIHIFQTSPSLFLAFITILGLALGSFLNVMIIRLPPIMVQYWRHDCFDFLEMPDTTEPESFIYAVFIKKSHCPKCKHHIRYLDNIPVISYLLLGGRCRDCHKKISKRYPIIELLTAGLFAIVAYKFGVTWQTFFGCLLTWIMLLQATIDIDNTFIPDEITLPMIWLGLLLSLEPIFASPTSAILGAVFGYVSLWLIAKLFLVATQKEGMGHGDFKLLAMLGAWLGWQTLPFVILFSSILGSIIGVLILVITKQGRNTRIPFGPFIAIAGWLALVWGPQINAWYLRYVGIIY